MIDTSFAILADRFQRLALVDESLPGGWVSPYRLIWGAAYSIGMAEKSGAEATIKTDHIPADLSTSLFTAVEHVDNLAWFHSWHASYMLTSAIFRVAAAAEKICYLAVPTLEELRQKLWSQATRPDSGLSQKLPKAHELLGQMPSRRERVAYLNERRDEFHSSHKVTRALLCAFMQTDRDKHVSYSPVKELAFDHALASQALLEVCDLWDEAIAAERRSVSSA